MTPCQLLPITLLIFLKADPAVVFQTCQPHMVLHCGWETSVDPSWMQDSDQDLILIIYRKSFIYKPTEVLQKNLPG